MGGKKLKIPDYKERYAKIPKKYKGGNCYKEAINYMLRNRHIDGLLLCHGWVSGRRELAGVRFSHAWVEDTKGNVIDPSQSPEKPLELPKFVFYAIGNVIEERVLKYDYTTMMDWIQRTSKAGPWEVKFDE